MATQLANELRHAVVVLGMHRSGTSAMARVVALAGAALPIHMLTPGPHNPEGFWEPHEVMALNERILAELDTSWNDPFGPREFRQRKVPWTRYLGEARDVIARNYGDAQFIVVKEPRATLLLDLWREALENEGYRVSYVIMIRRPDEVARSLKARDGTVMNKALITWTTYMLAAELGTRGRSRVFVSFDDLLDDPEEALNRIEGQLNVSFPRRTWETALETQEFLKTDSKHHTSSRWPRNFKNFPQVQRFYAYLLASSRDEPWNADISDEVALWLSQLENIFGPVLKQSEREVRQLAIAKEQIEHASSQTRETLENSLTAVRSELDAKVSQNAAESANLRALLDEARSSATQATALAEQLETALSNLRREHELRDQQLADSLAASQSDADAARQRALELESAIEALRHEHEVRDAAQTEQLDRANDEAAHLRAALETLTREHGARALELTQSLAQTTAESADLKSALETLTREHEARALELTRRLAQTTTENADLKAASDGLRREHEAREMALREELHSASAVGDAAQAEALTLRAASAARFSAQEAEAERLRAQNTELARALTEAIVQRQPTSRRWRFFTRA